MGNETKEVICGLYHLCFSSFVYDDQQIKNRISPCDWIPSNCPPIAAFLDFDERLITGKSRLFMGLSHILFLFLLILSTWAKGLSRLEQNEHRIRRQASCNQRRHNANSTVFHVAGNLCCNKDIQSLLLKFEINKKERLGDVARRIQKRIQGKLKHSFELIISTSDFAIASHYGGSKICKISSNFVGKKRQNDEFYILAYQTPMQYDLGNDKQELFLASIDAQEPMGSTPEGERGHFQDERINPLAGEGSASIQPSPKIARAGYFQAKYGNNTFLRQGQDLFAGESLLPSGTHCNRRQRSGDKCCSGALHEVMEEALAKLATSPNFDENGKALGILANVMQKKVQQKFGRIFEVIVSSADFSYASYQPGDFTCKFKSHALHVLAYETPVQEGYQPFNVVSEKVFSSISDRDPLGTADSNLPGESPPTSGLELETRGERVGFPQGSHCKVDQRLGSKCCNLPLFGSMHSTLKQMKAENTFNFYNKRKIAAEVCDRAEADLGWELKCIVAGDDFAVANHGDYMHSCKFRLDEYYIMAWEVNGTYLEEVEDTADVGLTSFLGCSGSIRALEGASCCSGTLRYTMVQAINEATNYDFTRINTEHVSRIVANMTQKMNNTRMETIISRGDFVWRTHLGETALYCKIDIYEFHALVFESGGTPYANEFAYSDVVAINSVPIQEEFFVQQPLNTIPLEVPLVPNQVLIQQIPPQIAQQAIPQQIVQIPQLAVPQQIGQIPQQIVQIPQQAVPQQIGQIPQQVVQVPQFQQQFLVPQNVPLQPPVQQVPTYSTYYNNAPPALGGGFCFSAETAVTTPNGPKNMSTLQVGDYVLTANITHAYYSQVNSWMHRIEDDTVEFLEVETESGKSLQLTGKHMIYRGKCNELGTSQKTTLPNIGEEIFADHLVTGDCLFVLENEKWLLEPIRRIETVKRRGFFAPLTSNGRIVVNNILASCYSEVKMPVLQTSFFTISSFIQRVLKRMTSWIAQANVDLPSSTSLWREMLPILLPTNSISLTK